MCVCVYIYIYIYIYYMHGGIKESIHRCVTGMRQSAFGKETVDYYSIIKTKSTLSEFPKEIFKRCMID